ncbi:MAG: protein kinase domain-containing protein [Streptosporangiaceae bacterium]
MSQLTLRDLTVERGGRPVVREVSVDIPAGQVTALLGPNGAGKSTLVLAVGGVLKPRAGSVLLEETDIAGRRPELIRQAGVAIVPEGRRLLPDLTVEDNLRVASYALTGAQAQSGRTRVLELFPQLTQRLSAPARTLSGGEQQMVVLAQALIGQPRYLLIDELSLGLAPVVVSRLIPVIAAVAESGTGVLLIEQFATVALGLAGHAHIMEGGRIRFSGPARELRDNPALLRSAYLLRGSSVQPAAVPPPPAVIPDLLGRTIRGSSVRPALGWTRMRRPGATSGGTMVEEQPGPAFAAGSRLAGYLLEEEIGAGGMAVVFRAHDERLDRPVALKVLARPLAADEGFRQRFLRESRAAAAVDDPHIIPVYEAGQAGGVLFLVMRYVSGGDVRGLLRREGPLPPARAAAIISPIASALDAAHAAGLVHRDVKPANMLVDARPGRPDHVYLSDFGIAKGSSSVQLTRPGLYLGTVAYMAPEQIDGRDIDGRLDQYALACAAFELLSGSVPFERDQDMAVIHAHLSQPPPPLSARLPRLPPAVDQVLARALAKRPEDRYPSCGAFADALRSAFGLAGYDTGAAVIPGDPATAVLGPAASGSGWQGAVGTRIATGGPGGDGRAELPGSRTITMLFTDIEGSTALLSRLGDRYVEALSAQRALLREQFSACGGQEMGTEGDSFFVVFASAADAVRCCVAGQRALAEHEWPGGATVRVRMGLHSGEAAWHEDDWVGMDVHRAARIAAAAHGGQVVVSEATRLLAAARLPAGVSLEDLGWHRLKDIEAPERIYQLVGPGLERRFPPLKSLGTQTSLPVPMTPFIGRADAVEEVTGLLGSSRLVTVTGPGGVGKTRLAVEVARQLAGRFADGACLVELAPVTEPALVPAAVVAALGLPQSPDLSAADALAAGLARVQLLIVLDNCEHIIEAAADLCEMIVHAGDDTRILATSQETLRVAGETRYRLSPLSVPPPGEQGQNGQSEAVSLFTDRAKRIDPHFELTSESAPVVARLVARLDGMPLAIELAAARIEALGVEQLLDRLDDRFALLATGDRRAAARQRSLAATVDWSYGLLTEDQQRVFRLLSVFPGPFTLDAATAIAGPGAEPAVLHLVDCSLISPPRTGRDGRARYLMLETLRAYGADRLAEAGEGQIAAAKLAGHALQVATQAAEGMQTSVGELAATRWLDAEDATTQQALTWALEHEPGLAMRLATALALWWVQRGRVTVGYAQLRAAAERAAGDRPAADPDGTWAAAQYWLGYLANLTGDFGAGQGYYTAALDAAADRPQSPVRADALASRSNCLLNLGHTAEAIEEARLALDLAQQIDYRPGQARALLNLSIAAQYAGDEEQALDWARQATRIDQRALPGRLARQCNHNLADNLIEAGDLPAAQDISVTELDRARQAGDLVSQSFCLDVLADLDQRSGRIPEAAQHLREALEIATRIGNRLRMIDCLSNCGHLCAATNRWADAVTMWAAYLARLAELGMSDIPAIIERRQEPLRLAEQSLGPDRIRAAEQRGQDLTLAAAAELAILLTGTDAPAPDDLARLSAKERELVILVAQGRSNTEIAAQLNLSAGTIRYRLDRIKDRAGCKRRADLTRLALQAGLI